VAIPPPRVRVYRRVSRSTTAIAENATLGQLVADSIANIVTGREDISALDTMIADWQSRGGDQIRQEFQDELAASEG
jgi:putative aldouronate transport system substrate-binding protein